MLQYLSTDYSTVFEMCHFLVNGQYFVKISLSLKHFSLDFLDLLQNKYLLHSNNFL